MITIRLFEKDFWFCDRNKYQKTGLLTLFLIYKNTSCIFRSKKICLLDTHKINERVLLQRYNRKNILENQQAWF